MKAAVGAAPGVIWLAWLLICSVNAGFAPTKCFEAAIAVAVAVLGSVARTPWARAGCWFALALAGNAAVLQTIAAGTLPRFQHYRSWSTIPGTWPWMMAAALSLQAGLVIGGAARILPLRRWLGRVSQRWQASILIVAGMAASAAFVGRDARAYAFEIAFYLFWELVNLANVLLIAYSVPAEACRILPRVWDLLALRRAAVAASLFVVVLTSLLSYFVYQHHPHIPDEVAYVIQARYLSEGRLTMPLPPALDAFRLDLITYEPTRWYSPFPPGWPIVLAIGMWTGLPWLINPILAGLCTYGIWLFIRDFHDAPTAATALPLLCASPWFLFMGMNLMAHMATLAFTIGAALAALRARNGGRWRWAFIAGCCTGFASVIRPYDGFILAVLIGFWLLIQRSRSSGLKAASLFALGCVLLGGLALPYNYYLTGRATKFPVDEYFDRTYGPGVNSLGFGPNKGMNWPIDPFPGHGLRDVVVNTALNVASTNVELLGWGTGSLLPLFVLFVLGPSKRDLLMLIPLIAIPAAYSLYWYHGGPEFGARYWFLIFPACIALAARGAERIREVLPSGSPPVSGTAIIALCLLALIVYVPWRAADKYYRYLKMSPELLLLARERHFGRSLVIVRGSQHPDYASAAVYNCFDTGTNAPIYAWDASPRARAQAIAAFPDRPIWVVDGPSVAGGHYKVNEGPVSATGRKVSSY